MSSFFTVPASQKKRKRAQDGATGSRKQEKVEVSRRRSTRDESISGSDISDDDGSHRDEADEAASETDEEDDPMEDPASKRVRLAEQYLANTQKEILEDVGFDAAEVDQENLRRRMGERLKEDTAEAKGRLYRWIAQDFDWTRAGCEHFRHHQKAVAGVAIAGDFAYTAGKDCVVVKWQLPQARADADPPRRRSKKPRKLLVSGRFGKNTNSRNADQHTKPILCIAASHDGQFVATGGADKKLIVWDAATLKPLKVFYQHRDSVLSLTFRRGTNQLFSASKDRTVKIWSLDELAYVETLFGHQDEVVDVSALAQEKCVTVGARDRTARLWKVVEESQLVFRGGGAPKKSRAAEIDSGIDAGEDDPPHEGSTDRVACIDDETFITGSDNGSLSLWNIHKKKAIHVFPLAHGLDPPLPLHEISAEVNPPESARTKPRPRWITALRAIPFSDLFVSGSWDGFIRVWRISADKRHIEPLARLPADKPIQEIPDSLEPSESSLTGQDASELGDRLDGAVNDIAISDRGDRAKDGVIIIAAIGDSHRLGRWTEWKDGRNRAVLLDIPRKTTSAMQADEAVENANTNGDEFAGFD